MSVDLKSVDLKSVDLKSVSLKRSSTKAASARPAPPGRGAIPARHARARALLVPPMLALGLAGCVAFERAPVEPLACDPELPGAWRLQAEGIRKTIHIDARCRTEDWPGLREQPVALDLTGFVLGRNRYIVIGPADAERALGTQSRNLSERTPEDAVFLVLYRIEGDRANAWLASPNLALAAIAQGRLHGRKLDDQYALIQDPARLPPRKLDDQHTLVQDEPDRLRAVLGEQAELLFDTRQKSMTLTRVENETAPP